MSTDLEHATLDAEVSGYVRKGWQVESRTATQAVLVKGKRPNHILHLILSVITFGVWAVLVWLPLSVFMHVERRTISLGPNGEIIRR